MKINEKISLLYLCTGNSCRSQMAEGLTKSLKGDLINAYSAGIETHGLNPNAVKVMNEIGIDISTHKSKHIDEFKNIKIDIIITVCGHAHETCPYCPTDCKIIHIGFNDPPKKAKELAEQGISEEEQLNCYRKVRDEIKQFVKKLPDIIAI